MATLIGLQAEISGIVEEVYRRSNEAEENRLKEYECAVRVQAWFRASRVRAYLHILHGSAVLVQRMWRGFVGRRRYRALLREKVFVMKLNHYNAMATKVQRVWRGFYVRKFVFDYHARRRYLAGLVVKNAHVRAALEEHAQAQQQRAEWQRESDQLQRLLDYTNKHHYLLSTQVKPGVFNSPFKAYPDELEFHLRAAKPHRTNPPKPFVRDVDDAAWRSYNLPSTQDPLPPIASAAPQGPFRAPSDVQAQRRRPWEPSLRVETSYTSVEAARAAMQRAERAREVAAPPQPFRRAVPTPYEPLLHTRSAYERPKYGHVHYREERASPGGLPDFRTVVPPVPLFDKLGKTYSQGQV